MKSFVDELQYLYDSKKEDKQLGTIYEGYKGIKTIFEDILNSLPSGSTYYVFGAIDVPLVFERFLVHWTRRRSQKKIQLKIIYHEEARNFIEKTQTMPLTEIRVLPKSYMTPAAVNVYGDKTATIVWTKNPIGFVVKSKDYAQSFQSYFDMLWGIARKI